MTVVIQDEAKEWWKFEDVINNGAMDFFPAGYDGEYWQVQNYKVDGALPVAVLACQSGQVVVGRKVNMS